MDQKTLTRTYAPLLFETGSRSTSDRPKTRETLADKDMTTFSRNLDWNLLKTFYEILQSGGVSRASRSLCRKQPAVSLALKRLEAHLDARLCGRGPKGFCLTDEGVLIGEICATISELVQRMPRKLANLSDEVAGRVSIQVVSGLVCETLDRSIARFHASHPNAEIIIDISTWESVVTALLRDEIDIGVAPASAHRADLNYEFLFEEVYRPYVGLGHPLYGKTFHDPGSLADEAFILTGADEPDALTEFRMQHGLGRNVAGISEHLDGAMRLTSLGLGICFLPEGYADPHVRSGLLWPVLLDFRLPSMPVFIITNPRAPRKLARQLLLVEFCGTVDRQ